MYAGKVNPKKKPEGPPRMLYLRELFAAMPVVFKEKISDLVCQNQACRVARMSPETYNSTLPELIPD